MYQHHISDDATDVGGHGSCLAGLSRRLALFTRSFSLPEFKRRYFVRVGFDCIKILKLPTAPKSADMVYRS